MPELLLPPPRPRLGAESILVSTHYPVLVPRPNQRVISLPKDLVDRVETSVKGLPDLGYTSIADFVKDAIREKLAREVERRFYLELPTKAFRKWESSVKKHPEWGFDSTEDLVNDVLLHALDALAKGRGNLSPEALDEVEAHLEMAVQDYERALRALAERGEFPKDAVRAEVSRFREAAFESTRRPRTRKRTGKLVRTH